jgi:hypothetical protein
LPAKERTMRHYIRHPVSMPVEIRLAPDRHPADLRLRNISVGGLAVCADAALDADTEVEVCIRYVEPAFVARARVIWCHPQGDCGHELGLALLDADDAYAARMVEQVCYIEDYRRSVLQQQGRQLDAEEAAAEWISRYAARFPGSGSPTAPGHD